jgi:hypothetical protein
MKQMLTMVLIFLTSAALAQPERNIRPGQGMQKLESMHIAYLTRELNLTPEEAQQFWPVYNKYRNELKATFKQGTGSADPLEQQQKMLDIRKKYRGEFAKSLGNERANRVFGSADHFRDMVKKAAERRRKAVQQQRQPMHQKNQHKKNHTPSDQMPL